MSEPSEKRKNKGKETEFWYVSSKENCERIFLLLYLECELWYVSSEENCERILLLLHLECELWYSECELRYVCKFE